jgi:hypothetical protein
MIFPRALYGQRSAPAQPESAPDSGPLSQHSLPPTLGRQDLAADVTSRALHVITELWTLIALASGIGPSAKQGAH